MPSRTVVTYLAGSWDVAGVAPTTNPVAAPVSSVFGRTGAVVAAANDYTEAQLSFTDITTNNVSTSKHGFTPKLPNDATKYLDGTGAYTVPPGTSAVASVFGRTGAVVAATNDYSEAQISFTDITTNDVSTSKHGYAPKAPNDATKFLNGAAAYAVPAYPVTSVFGRTGAVVAASNDYTFAQVSGATDAVGGVAWTVIRASSDLGRNTTTTVSIDPTLQFTATNGSMFEIEMDILYVSTAGGATPDMKIAFGEDNSLRGSAVTVGLNSADSSVVSAGNTALTNQPIYGTAATNRLIQVRCWHQGAGGTFQLQWAQGTSNGNDTTRKAGSVLRYRVIS